MVRLFVTAVLLASAVFAAPVENEQTEGKGYMQQMLEAAGEYQGDILLTEEQRAAINSKTGMINTQLRWPSNTIPYEIVAGQFCE